VATGDDQAADAPRRTVSTSGLGAILGWRGFTHAANCRQDGRSANGGGRAFAFQLGGSSAGKLAVVRGSGSDAFQRADCHGRRYYINDHIRLSLRGTILPAPPRTQATLNLRTSPAVDGNATDAL